MPRIRSRIFLALLVGAARATRGRFRFFHEAVRHGHLLFAAFVLPRWLSRLAQATVRVDPRHSVRVPGQFHAFESDLDVSLVLASEPSAEMLRDLREGYTRLRRWFPFLGESEIYLESEWNRKKELDRDDRSAIRLLWMLRKYRWIEAESSDQLYDPYHREKAQAALARLRRQLGSEDGSWAESLRKRLEVVLGPEVLAAGLAVPDGTDRILEGESEFLGWKLRIVGDPGASAAADGILTLPRAVLLALLAVTPDGEWAIAGESEVVLALRRDHPRVRQAYRSVLESELLLMRSVCRASEAPSAKLLDWVRNLQGKLAEA